MKKLFALTLTLLFLSAGLAGATDFTLTGSYFARGTWFDNEDGKGIDSVNAKNQYGVYDHELSLDATWQISPVSKVYARLEIRDEDWAVSTNPTEASYAGSEPDDNIYVEHLWGQHTFTGSNTTVRAGLMKAGSWSTDFGNEGTDAYRIGLSKKLKIGRLYGYTEKEQRTIAGAAETGGADADKDGYAIGLATRVGGITLTPLLKFVDAESNNAQSVVVGSGATASFDNIGFEGEFLYIDINNDDPSRDASAWGAYANLWAQLGAVKIGGLIAHGSYDEDTHQGFYFGDDFDGGGAMLLGDEVLMHDNGQGVAPGLLSYNDLQAATLMAVYLSYTASEKLTLGAYAGYADSNVDNPGNVFGGGKWDGASAWEVNITGEYKITPNVIYSAGAATAQIKYGDYTSLADPDEAVEIFHKLSFNF